jgi:adenine-specific DNA-methyltransferase
VSIAKTIETPIAAKDCDAWLAGGNEAEHGRARKHELGQFLTPEPVADFMASLFRLDKPDVNLLDAGAGDGALIAAVIRRLCGERRKTREISITAYEIDSAVITRLQTTISRCRMQCERAGIAFSAKVHNADFIESVVPMVRNELFTRQSLVFNTVILNPPYRKIRSNSAERLLLRSAGIETTNLYAGFLALAVRLLGADGEMVSITPRSFCNGPYFRSFRVEFLASMSLRRLHVFESRSAAFNGDDVLQENIIFHATKSSRKPEQVVISSSSGEPGALVCEHAVPYCDVVSRADPEQFIHLVTDSGQSRAKAAMARLSATLSDLGLSVSTGRVVSFRVKSFLRDNPVQDAAPLIHPCHFNGGYVRWPRDDGRKPNAIVVNEETRELLVPSDTHVLVKRFTSKEERRRVVACIFDPHRVSGIFVGFENHLNYYHANGHGLPMILARGLTAFLNSTLVDVCFRQFNGHTQVNATDLRNLRYPSRQQLEHLGGLVDDPAADQEQLDSLLEKELHVTT